MELVVFGAQSIALSAFEAIHNLYPGKNITCFLVTERGINPETLLGLQVIELVRYADMLSQQEKDNAEFS